jgi:hypothetical protein
LLLHTYLIVSLCNTSLNCIDLHPALTLQRLLEHKVSQHHHLSTSTAFENGQPRVVAKRPPAGSENAPAVQVGCFAAQQSQHAVICSI